MVLVLIITDASVCFVGNLAGAPLGTGAGCDAWIFLLLISDLEVDISSNSILNITVG